MANLDRIVNVSIDLKTTGVTEEGFSTLLVVGPHAYDMTRVLEISSVDELTELGFDTASDIYLAASDALSQTPRPATIKVGRFQCDKIDVAPMVTEIDDDGVATTVVATTFEEGTTYQVKIIYTNSENDEITETYAYTVKENDTFDKICSALGEKVQEGLDEAHSSYQADGVTLQENGAVYYERGVDADGIDVKFKGYRNGTNFEIQCTSSTFDFKVDPSSNMKITGFQPAGLTVAENMALITQYDNDFYGIVYTSRVQSQILEMANWTESHTKIYGTAIAEKGAYNPLSTTDTGYLLNNNNFYRTFWFYHADADTDYPDAAVMTRCFNVQPGGETWANKKLSAVTTDNLTEAQYKAITKKCGNTFEKFRNVTITQNGVVASGEWIDVIRFRDWLVETIKTEEFAMLINVDKLPYTDGGIAIIESKLDAVLQLGQKRGGIAPTEYDDDNNPNYGYVISVPKASSISANVKASRKLTDVKFVARLAGAIHAVTITGDLTYEALNG